MSKIPNKELFAIFPDMELYKLDDGEAKIIEFIGENVKQTLVITNDSSEESISLLSKILGAVKYDLQHDVALVDVKKQNGLSFRKLNKCLPFDKLICFGLSPESLGIHMKLITYQVMDWNKIKILFSEDLPTIAKNQQKKGQLWKALQVFFES